MRPAIVGGDRVEGGERYPVVDPSTGRQFEEVAMDVDGSIVGNAADAAEAGANALAGMTLADRAKILLRAADILEARKEEAAGILAAEAGKPIVDSRVEVGRAVSLMRAAAAEAAFALEERSYRVDAYEYPPGNGKRIVIGVREPIGTVGAILPFNFPVNSFAHKVAPNIAAGNAVVVKPAPATPLSPLLMAEIMYGAGLPRGALSVVPGTAAAGEALVSSPKISGITFTGSTSVGLTIASRASALGKRIMMEMGGSDPLIVMEDADLEAAAAIAARARFEYAGQNCNAAKRVLVSESVYRGFLEMFVRRVRALRVGDARDEGTEVGPLISERSAANIAGIVEDAVDRGARLEAGGRRMDRPGFFFEPTVVSDAPLDSRSMREEVFGPVAPVRAFSDEDEAVEIANSTVYGLQAAIISRDVGRSLRIARRLRAGAVILNESTRLRWDTLPFGGVKLSGLGPREGVRSTMEAMTELKLISMLI
ncbi:MAG: aldehyde dehydrogenase family protein [Nitrososphaeria archaeon]